MRVSFLVPGRPIDSSIPLLSPLVQPVPLPPEAYRITRTAPKADTSSGRFRNNSPTTRALSMSTSRRTTTLSNVFASQSSARANTQDPGVARSRGLPFRGVNSHPGSPSRPPSPHSPSRTFAILPRASHAQSTSHSTDPSGSHHHTHHLHSAVDGSLGGSTVAARAGIRVIHAGPGAPTHSRSHSHRPFQRAELSASQTYTLAHPQHTAASQAASSSAAFPNHHSHHHHSSPLGVRGRPATAASYSHLRRARSATTRPSTSGDWVRQRSDAVVLDSSLQNRSAVSSSLLKESGRRLQDVGSEGAASTSTTRGTLSTPRSQGLRDGVGLPLRARVSPIVARMGGPSLAAAVARAVATRSVGGEGGGDGRRTSQAAQQGGVAATLAALAASTNCGNSRTEGGASITEGRALTAGSAASIRSRSFSPSVRAADIAAAANASAGGNIISFVAQGGVNDAGGLAASYASVGSVFSTVLSVGSGGGVGEGVRSGRAASGLDRTVGSERHLGDTRPKRRGGGHSEAMARLGVEVAGSGESAGSVHDQGGEGRVSVVPTPCRPMVEGSKGSAVLQGHCGPTVSEGSSEAARAQWSSCGSDLDGAATPGPFAADLSLEVDRCVRSPESSFHVGAEFARRDGSNAGAVGGTDGRRDLVETSQRGGTRRADGVPSPAVTLPTTPPSSIRDPSRAALDLSGAQSSDPSILASLKRGTQRQPSSPAVAASHQSLAHSSPPGSLHSPRGGGGDTARSLGDALAADQSCSGGVGGSAGVGGPVGRGSPDRSSARAVGGTLERGSRLPVGPMARHVPSPSSSPTPRRSPPRPTAHSREPSHSLGAVRRLGAERAESGRPRNASSSVGGALPRTSVFVSGGGGSAVPTSRFAALSAAAVGVPPLRLDKLANLSQNDTHFVTSSDRAAGTKGIGNSVGHQDAPSFDAAYHDASAAPPPCERISRIEAPPHVVRSDRHPSPRLRARSRSCTGKHRSPLRGARETRPVGDKWPTTPTASAVSIIGGFPRRGERRDPAESVAAAAARVRAARLSTAGRSASKASKPPQNDLCHGRRRRRVVGVDVSYSRVDKHVAAAALARDRAIFGRGTGREWAAAHAAEALATAARGRSSSVPPVNNTDVDAGLPIRVVLVRQASPEAPALASDPATLTPPPPSRDGAVGVEDTVMIATPDLREGVGAVGAEDGTASVSVSPVPGSGGDADTTAIVYSSTGEALEVVDELVDPAITARVQSLLCSRTLDRTQPRPDLRSPGYFGEEKAENIAMPPSRGRGRSSSSPRRSRRLSSPRSGVLLHIPAPGARSRSVLSSPRSCPRAARTTSRASPPPDAPPTPAAAAEQQIVRPDVSSVGLRGEEAFRQCVLRASALFHEQAHHQQSTVRSFLQRPVSNDDEVLSGGGAGTVPATRPGMESSVQQPVRLRLASSVHQRSSSLQASRGVGDAEPVTMLNFGGGGGGLDDSMLTPRGTLMLTFEPPAPVPVVEVVPRVESQPQANARSVHGHLSGSRAAALRNSSHHQAPNARSTRSTSLRGRTRSTRGRSARTRSARKRGSTVEAQSRFHRGLSHLRRGYSADAHAERKHGLRRPLGFTELAHSARRRLTAMADSVRHPRVQGTVITSTNKSSGHLRQGGDDSRVDAVPLFSAGRVAPRPLPAVPVCSSNTRSETSTAQWNVVKGLPPVTATVLAPESSTVLAAPVPRQSVLTPFVHSVPTSPPSQY